MIPMNNWLKQRSWLTLVIIVIAGTNFAIFLNIPFIRQILGFIFLTILPGLLILQILKLNKVEPLEKFVLSVGLSISFLMFFGLLINNLSLGLGYKTPLATVSLLISFNITFVVLVIIGYRRNEKTIFSLPNLNLTTAEKAFLVVPIVFPALSIFGMHVMYTTDNNIILMSLLFLIPIYGAFVCLFNRKFPKRLYPVVIFLISLSLLLLLSLRSNHIIGSDTHLEFFFFLTTLDNLHWSAFSNYTLDACLSISLLPTIYQSILNVSPEFLFKILYSLVYSISPLVVYVISKKYVGELYGFLASCFFMFQVNFLFTAYNARTNTAVLFFALAMMILFNDKIDPVKKRILFIVFVASCMVSHYSTMYIFFFIILGSFLGVWVLSKKYAFKKVISLTTVILFFAFIFLWYSQVTETAFNSGVDYIGNTLTNLNKFFIEESRRGDVRSLIGIGIGQEGIPQKIEFVFTWLTFVFISIGIITLVRGYKELLLLEPNLKKQNFLFLKNKFEVEYFVIALACSGLLVAMVALPYVSTAYNIDRLYAVAITILSVFFVIGGITLSKCLFFFKNKICATRKNNRFFGKAFFSKETFMTQWDSHNHENNKVFSGQRGEGKNASQVLACLIILLVLIPYFLCVTGMMCQIFSDPRAIILNSEGRQYDELYVHDQESYSAKWLGNYATGRPKVYADYRGYERLVSQSKIAHVLTNHGYWPLSNSTIIMGGYIYLRYRNVVNGELVGSHGELSNMTDCMDSFAKKNEIYDSGCSKILR